MKYGLSGLISLMLLIVLSVSVLGFGISPSNIYNDNLIKGSTFDTNIRVSHGIIENGQLKIELKKDYMDSWFEVKGGEKTSDGYLVNIAPESQATEVMVTVQVPKDAPNGLHQTNFRVMALSSPSKVENGMGSVVQMAAQVDVMLTITGDEKKAFEIQLINLPKTEEGSSLKAYIKINNYGNVQLFPLTVNLTVYDSEKKEVYSAQEKASEIINAFTAGTQTVTFANPLNAGFYTAKMVVFDETTKFNTPDLPLEILELQGEKKISGFLSKIQIPGMAKLNAPVEFIGIFNNNGNVPLSAKLMVELFKNNQKIETLSSETKTIEKGKDSEFKIQYIPTQLGLVDIKVYVVFNDQTSNIMETSMNIGAEEKAASVSFASLIDIAAIILIFVVVLAIIYWVIHKTKQHPIQPVTQKTTPRKPKKAKKHSNKS